MSADVANTEPAPATGLFSRIVAWARRVRLADMLAMALAAAAVVSGVATYAAMSDWGQLGPDPTTVVVLLNLDLGLLLCLTVLVARRLVHLWSAHRAGAAGSKLHVKLVLLFGVVAVTPAILVAVFSALFFTFGIQTWFGDRVRTALMESSEVARAYLAEHQQAIRGDALAVATDLNRQWMQLSRSNQVLENALSTQAAIRGLTEAVIFTEDWQVRAKAGYTFALQSGELIPFQAIAQADLGSVAVVTGESADRVRALVKLDTVPGAYLYVGRFVDREVLAHVSRTEAAVNEYLQLEGRSADLEISLTLLFSVVALLLLFVSVWFGLTLANRLAKPISDLINASERVRGGDLTVQVTESADSDEIATLGRAFNRMTRRLDVQQTELRRTNLQLDERRRFTETVLGGVSSGVVGLDMEGRITLPNRAASELLGLDLSKAVGKTMVNFVPEFAGLMDEISQSPDRHAQREIQIIRGNKTQMFLVRVAPELEGDAVAGYVVTFDDITALQVAQRQAAWADVARRIAHEIKNPLTPIQLSAERLKRKYLDRMGDDSALFAQCTDTIIRHVGDIGQMVDEFSSFARMPRPVMTSADLGAIVREAVVLQRTAYPQIMFSVDLPATPMALRCDARQVGQALTNVLKNAVEAIDQRFGVRGEATIDPAARGHVTLRVERDDEGTRIRVSDNGVGLPPSERHRLTEPYVTTRAKGTGLGLAIVKKVLEDHGARLTLEDMPEVGIPKLGSPSGGAPDGGAQVTFHFPAALTISIPPQAGRTSVAQVAAGA